MSDIEEEDYDLDFDMDMDFDDGGLDDDLFAAPEPIKDDREPILIGADEFSKSFKETILKPETAMKAVDAALPRHVREVVSIGDQTLTSLESAYRETADKLKPTLVNMKRSARAMKSALGDVFPKKVSEWLDEKLAEEDRDHPREMSKEELQAQHVTKTLAEIFENQHRMEHERNSREEVLNITSVKQQGETLSVNQRVHAELQKLNLREENIGIAVQRKMLELSIQKWQIQSSLLAAFSEYKTNTFNQLKDITYNTGLPELVKQHTSEYMKQLGLAKLFDVATKSLGGQMGITQTIERMVKTGASNIQNNFISAFDTFAGQIGQVMDSAGDLVNGGIDDETKAMLGEQVYIRSDTGKLAAGVGSLGGSMAADEVARWLGEKVGRKLSQYETVKIINEIARRGIDKAPFVLNNYLRNGLTITEEDNGLTKAVKWTANMVRDLTGLSSAAASENSGSIKKFAQKNIHATAEFNQMTQRSIVHVIPGLLARILRSTEAARTGKVGKLLHYDYEKGGFINEAMYIENVREQVFKDMSSIQYGLDNGVKQLLSEDDLKNIDNDERRKLERFMVDISRRGEEITLEKLLDDKNSLPHGLKSRIKRHLVKETGWTIENKQTYDAEKRKVLNNKLSEINRLVHSVPDIYATIQNRAIDNPLYVDALRRLGLMSSDEDSMSLRNNAFYDFYFSQRKEDIVKDDAKRKKDYQKYLQKLDSGTKGWMARPNLAAIHGEGLHEPNAIQSGNIAPAKQMVTGASLAGMSGSKKETSKLRGFSDATERTRYQDFIRQYWDGTHSRLDDLVRDGSVIAEHIQSCCKNIESIHQTVKVLAEKQPKQKEKSVNEISFDPVVNAIMDGTTGLLTALSILNKNVGYISQNIKPYTPKNGEFVYTPEGIRPDEITSNLINWNKLARYTRTGLHRGVEYASKGIAKTFELGRRAKNFANQKIPQPLAKGLGVLEDKLLSVDLYWPDNLMNPVLSARDFARGIYIDINGNVIKSLKEVTGNIYKMGEDGRRVLVVTYDDLKGKLVDVKGRYFDLSKYSSLFSRTVSSVKDFYNNHLTWANPINVLKKAKELAKDAYFRTKELVMYDVYVGKEQHPRITGMQLMTGAFFCNGKRLYRVKDIVADVYDQYNDPVLSLEEIRTKGVFNYKGEPYKDLMDRAIDSTLSAGVRAIDVGKRAFQKIKDAGLYVWNGIKNIFHGVFNGFDLSLEINAKWTKRIYELLVWKFNGQPKQHLDDIHKDDIHKPVDNLKNIAKEASNVYNKAKDTWDNRGQIVDDVLGKVRGHVNRFNDSDMGRRVNENLNKYKHTAAGRYIHGMVTNIDKLLSKYEINWEQFKGMTAKEIVAELKNRGWRFSQEGEKAFLAKYNQLKNPERRKELLHTLVSQMRTVSASQLGGDAINHVLGKLKISDAVQYMQESKSIKMMDKDSPGMGRAVFNVLKKGDYIEFSKVDTQIKESFYKHHRKYYRDILVFKYGKTLFNMRLFAKLESERLSGKYGDKDDKQNGIAKVLSGIFKNPFKSAKSKREERAEQLKKQSKLGIVDSITGLVRKGSWRLNKSKNTNEKKDGALAKTFQNVSNAKGFKGKLMAILGGIFGAIAGAPKAIAGILGGTLTGLVKTLTFGVKGIASIFGGVANLGKGLLGMKTTGMMGAIGSGIFRAGSWIATSAVPWLATAGAKAVGAVLFNPTAWAVLGLAGVGFGAYKLWSWWRDKFKEMETYRLATYGIVANNNHEKANIMLAFEKEMDSLSKVDSATGQLQMPSKIDWNKWASLFWDTTVSGEMNKGQLTKEQLPRFKDWYLYRFLPNFKRHKEALFKFVRDDPRKQMEKVKSLYDIEDEMPDGFKPAFARMSFAESHIKIPGVGTGFYEYTGLPYSDLDTGGLGIDHVRAYRDAIIAEHKSQEKARISLEGRKADGSKRTKLQVEEEWGRGELISQAKDPNAETKWKLDESSQKKVDEASKGKLVVGSDIVKMTNDKGEEKEFLASDIATDYGISTGTISDWQAFRLYSYGLNVREGNVDQATKLLGLERAIFGNQGWYKLNPNEALLISDADVLCEETFTPEMAEKLAVEWAGKFGYGNTDEERKAWLEIVLKRVWVVMKYIAGGYAHYGIKQKVDAQMGLNNIDKWSNPLVKEITEWLNEDIDFLRLFRKSSPSLFKDVPMWVDSTALIQHVKNIAANVKSTPLKLPKSQEDREKMAKAFQQKVEDYRNLQRSRRAQMMGQSTEPDAQGKSAGYPGANTSGYRTPNPMQSNVGGSVAEQVAQQAAQMTKTKHQGDVGVARDYYIEYARKQGRSENDIRNALAIMAKETGGFKSASKENLNYSLANLKSRKDFMKRIQKAGKTAEELANNPEALANVIYMDKYGAVLGNTQEGDGWKYRGGSLLQLTGRENHRRVGKLIGVDLEGNPDLLSDPEIAAKAADAYLQMRRAYGQPLEVMSNKVNRASGEFEKVLARLPEVDKYVKGSAERLAQAKLPAVPATPAPVTLPSAPAPNPMQSTSGYQAQTNATPISGVTGVNPVSSTGQYGSSISPVQTQQVNVAQGVGAIAQQAAQQSAMNDNAAITVKTWLDIAFKEIGVAETNGPTSNPRIMEYHQSTGAKSPPQQFGGDWDNTPWCSSFVNWVMKKAGYKGTNSMLAMSWKDWKEGQVLSKPALGSIMVSRRKSGGHVGFVVGLHDDGKIALLGGNQSNSVRVSAYGTKNLVCYVLPKGITPIYNLERYTGPITTYPSTAAEVASQNVNGNEALPETTSGGNTTSPNIPIATQTQSTAQSSTPMGNMSNVAQTASQAAMQGVSSPLASIPDGNSGFNPSMAVSEQMVESRQQVDTRIAEDSLKMLREQTGLLKENVSLMGKVVDGIKALVEATKATPVRSQNTNPSAKPEEEKKPQSTSGGGFNPGGQYGPITTTI